MKDISEGVRRLGSAVKDRSVLFITTKNLDYIRNTQEVELLKEHAARMDVLGYCDKSYIARLIKIYLRLLFAPLGRYDTIFAGFAPQLILPLFHWRFRKKRLIVDFFISVYDTLVFDRRKFREGGLLAEMARRLDRFTLRRADTVVCDTKAHGEYFVNELGARPSSLIVLYLQADRGIYKPRPAPETRDPRFTVLYFGSMLPLQGIDVLFEAAKLLSADRAVLFDIIGPVPEKLLAAYGSLENLRLTPWLSQPELARRIAAADLCLAGHFNSHIAKASRTIPGKAYIYQAMGKPFILGENPANRELFEEDGMHYFVEMGNAEKLAEKIAEIKSKSEKWVP